MLTELPWVPTLNHNLSLLSLLGTVALVAWLIFILVKKKSVFHTLISTYAISIGIGATGLGIFLTLFYSEYLHFATCELCWFQRIFLYPQFFIFIVALFIRDKKVWIYSAVLSSLGLIIALYHQALQMGYDLYKPCSTALFAADCAKPSFVEFGFVTFPYMSVVLFAFLLVVALTVYRARDIR